MLDSCSSVICSVPIFCCDNQTILPVQGFHYIVTCLVWRVSILPALRMATGLGPSNGSTRNIPLTLITQYFHSCCMQYVSVVCRCILSLTQSLTLSTNPCVFYESPTPASWKPTRVTSIQSPELIPSQRGGILFYLAAGKRRWWTLLKFWLGCCGSGGPGVLMGRVGG